MEEWLFNALFVVSVMALIGKIVTHTNRLLNAYAGAMSTEHQPFGWGIIDFAFGFSSASLHVFF